MRLNKMDLGSYKGVNLDQVLAVPLYASVVSNALKAVLYSNSLDDNGADCDVLVVYTHARSNRQDYLQIVTNLVSYIRKLSPKLIVMSSKFSLNDKVALIKHFIRSVGLLNTLKGSTLYRFYLILMVARAKVNIDQVYTFLQKNNCKIVVSFCDAHDCDNILAQCANKLGKITVTLQHGQYIILGHDCAENMALTNVVSDYLCAWGEATCCEFNKVGHKIPKAVPLGSLRSFNELSRPYTVSSLKQAENKPLLCLMLNADIQSSQNEKMIEIINGFCDSSKMQYIVRFHPKNNKSHYTKLFGQCYLGPCSEVNKSDVVFSVAYTSGVMVEQLILGELVFLYQDEFSPDVFKQEIIGFKDSRQLEDKVFSIYRNKSFAASELNKVRDFFIESKNVDKGYHSFFLGLMLGLKNGIK